MNTTKEHSRLLLALLLLVAGLAGAMRPQRVVAQSQPVPGSSLSWEYIPNTKTLSITGSGDMPDFAIFMNQPWGAFREQIETVTIGAGVTSVGKNAFLGCTALTAVTLPSSVTTIGAFAFVSCKALTGITIPSGVKTIKESVFFSCTALTSVTLPEGLQTIGASAFLGCSLTNVTLPNSVTTMGESAFSSCTALTNVTLSDKLTTIEERAFNGCSQLKNVTIPNSVTTIGNGAFAQCSALKNVNVFWDTPLTISADAFSGIELNKVKLYVPAGKKGAYQAADVWKGFDVQEIPGGNLSGGLHWQYIPSTKTLTITGTGNMPDFNFPINQPWGAFRGQIENVTIGAGVKSVGENAFASCKKLTAVTLPSSVTTIGVYAFSNCKALTGITIPSGVKTIKESAFYGCTALTSVTLPEGLTTIEEGVFTNCDVLASIELPASLQTIGASALDAPVLTEIKVKAGSAHFEAAEGVLYNKGKTALLRYPRKKPGTTFTIPASVTTIKEYAFTNCTALTGVTIPKDVTTIGESAFQGCTALTSVTLPADAKLTTIEQGAFYACEMLTSITLPEGLQTIGGNVFNTCEKLPSITIPKSVTTIGDGAFAYCSALKDVTVLWNTPLTIPSGVFAGITPPTGVTLHVPAGTGEAYQGKDVWKEFTIVDQPWGDLSTGLHWAYDAANHSLTITNPTPGTPQPIPDFAYADAQPWKDVRNEIEKVKIEAGVTSVGNKAFHACEKLTNITLPAGLERLGDGAFGECGALASITLPEGLQTIERNAFGECLALTHVTIPKSVTTIGDGAFTNCWKLASVTLPADAQLGTIGENAFYGCEKLASITIPKSVTTIGESAFAYCMALKDVTVAWTDAASIPVIQSNVFDGITPPTGVTLHVPAGTGEAYQGKDVWKEFTIVEQPWGDLSTGLHWAYDAADHSLTITNPTPDTPQPMPDFADPTKLPWEAYRGEIQKVTIGAGVNHVGKYAFTNCEKLTSVTLPTAGLKEIEKNAFGGCEKLTSINLPEGLKTIGEGAFTACFVLSDLTIPKSVETIEENAFYQCGSLTHVTLPADAQLTTIGKNAFFRCRSLTNLTIPKNVTTIGQSAFTECTALKSITLPDGLQTIGENAFLDCAALASISIPKSVTTIGNEAFSRCKALKDVTVFWETPLQISSEVFNHLTLEKIRLHVPAYKIGAYKAKFVWQDFIVMSDRGDLAGGLKWQMDATYTLTIINPTPGSPQPMPDFANPDEQPWESFRSEIQAVTIEDGVSSVGENAFVNCNKMTHVTLPKSVTTIRGAFAGCNKMTHVTLPADAKLDTIGKDAFIRCTALTSISLPKSTTTIEDRAFNLCEALTSVTLPADGKLQTIGVNAFGGCVKLKRITIPHSVTKIEGSAFNSCKALTSVTLPDNAQFTKIEFQTFQYCKALERITIPNHVDKIKTDAFNGCTALTSVTLPKSVTEIEWSAFQDCKALKDMTVAWTDTASIPNISPNVFRYTPPATVKLSDIRLHVPHGTVAAYQSKDVWKEFTIVEQPLPPTPTPPTPTPTPTPTPQLPDRPSAGTKIGGLTLSATNFTLNGERTFRFTVTIAPAHAADKRLSVSSSDEAVVRVRILPTEETRRGLRAAPDPAVVTIEGTVCGLGKAKIHVKTTDGSNLTATCHVDVRALPTANIEAPATRLYTAAGHLHLTLPAATAVNVYNLTGTLVRTFIAPAGTSSVALPQGVYVVRAGTHTEKVFVD